jgi:flagellar hook assembly protein FlgD
VTIEIFNIAGQKVSALINQRMEAGKHTIRWDGKADGGADLASGVYLYRLKAGEYSDVKKMMLLK